jgi:hypothetical protein
MLTRSSSSHVIFSLQKLGTTKKKKKENQLNKGENKIGSTSICSLLLTFFLLWKLLTLHTTNKQTNKQKSKHKHNWL